MKHPGNLQKSAGATHKNKRVGRGAGSGHGGTAGRGANGQKSRSGAKIRIGFEGGQMPMNRRLPKFGFTNRFRIDYQEVNVGRLQELVTQNKIKPSNTINAELLYSLGVLRKKNIPYKVLGNGELKSALTIMADKATKSAYEKVKAAGGTITTKNASENVADAPKTIKATEEKIVTEVKEDASENVTDVTDVPKKIKETKPKERKKVTEDTSENITDVPKETKPKERKKATKDTSESVADVTENSKQQEEK